MMFRIVLIATLVACGSHDAPAPTPQPQQPTPPQPKPEDDPVARRMLPPELVLGHAVEIGLRPDQREAIVSEVQRVQGEMPRLQSQMLEARDKIVAALDGQPIDLAQLSERADALFAIESKVKHAQLGLVAKIRNVLTPEQRAQLERLRDGH
jgi:Spy/CpxP family protein refolding chaperone